jgi:hypothetical protein
MRLSISMLLFGLAGGGLSGAAFQNGGFETPVLPGTPTGFDFVVVPTGWVKFDPSCGGIANCTGSALFLQLYSAFGLPAAGGQGTQAFGFGGNFITTGSLVQTFDTTPGATYHVSFQYVIQQGAGFEDLVLDVLNGPVSGVATNSAGCTGSPGCLASTGTVRFNTTAWVTRTLDFTATVPSTSLRFSDFSGLEPSDHIFTNWGLDAVSVTQTGGPTAVPEPSGLALIVCGLAAITFLKLKALYRFKRLSPASEGSRTGTFQTGP